jgi:hypothetical protein
MNAKLACLIYLGMMAVLFFTGYRPIKVSTPSDAVFIPTTTTDPGFYEDGMEIVISFKSEESPLQVELIKKYDDNPSRSILRTRISENASPTDLSLIVGSFSNGDYQLGDSGYRLRVVGSPMLNYFQSIIWQRGSYDCIMFAGDWELDRENKLIIARGNNISQQLASQK